MSKELKAAIAQEELVLHALVAWEDRLAAQRAEPSLRQAIMEEARSTRYRLRALRGWE